MLWQAVVWGCSAVLTFVGRVLFMKYLGAEYMGVSGLFTSIMGVLTFVELGFGPAFVYCMYKPIAENDEHHIAQVLRASERAYRIIIGGFVAGGLIVLPFLRSLITGGQEIDDPHLRLYFTLFFLEQVIPYVFLTRSNYVTARQKGYQLAPFTVIFTFATAALRIAILIATRNYVAYASVGVAVALAQRFAVNAFIKKKYPEVSLRVRERLPQEDRDAVRRNVRGSIWGKIGSVLTSQTDSIFISAGINVTTLGLVANYVSIKNILLTFASMVDASLVSGMGDLIVRESKEKQLDVFYTFLILKNSILGLIFCFVALLSTPIITLFFGADKCIDPLTITLLSLGFYFTFQVYSLSMLPTAGGRLHLGAYLSTVEGVLNIAVSFLLLKLVGLPGIYAGTLISVMVSFIGKPFYIFRGMYNQSPGRYFARSALDFLNAVLAFALCFFVRERFFAGRGDLVAILVQFVLMVGVYSGMRYLIWNKDHNFQECIRLVTESVRKLLRRKPRDAA